MESSLIAALHFDMVLLWGAVATILMIIIMDGCRGLGISRISFSFMLGTVFTSNRDLAEVLGFLVNFVIGWLFAFFYALIFTSLHYHSWWLGLIIGILHSLFISLAVFPLMPHIHPRMANEHEGPTPTRMLEPPGLMGLNYGRRTPLVNFSAHMVYGIILGIFVVGS
jgi:hypothetical protein